MKIRVLLYRLSVVILLVNMNETIRPRHDPLNGFIHFPDSSILLKKWNDMVGGKKSKRKRRRGTSTTTPSSSQREHARRTFREALDVDLQHQKTMEDLTHLLDELFEGDKGLLAAFPSSLQLDHNQTSRYLWRLRSNWADPTVDVRNLPSNASPEDVGETVVEMIYETIELWLTKHGSATQPNTSWIQGWESLFQPKRARNTKDLLRFQYNGRDVSIAGAVLTEEGKLELRAAVRQIVFVARSRSEPARPRLLSSFFVTAKKLFTIFARQSATSVSNTRPTYACILVMPSVSIHPRNLEAMINELILPTTSSNANIAAQKTSLESARVDLVSRILRLLHLTDPSISSTASLAPPPFSNYSVPRSSTSPTPANNLSSSASSHHPVGAARNAFSVSELLSPTPRPTLLLSVPPTTVVPGSYSSSQSIHNGTHAVSFQLLQATQDMVTSSPSPSVIAATATTVSALYTFTMLVFTWLLSSCATVTEAGDSARDVAGEKLGEDFRSFRATTEAMVSSLRDPSSRSPHSPSSSSPHSVGPGPAAPSLEAPHPPAPSINFLALFTACHDVADLLDQLTVTLRAPSTATTPHQQERRQRAVSTVMDVMENVCVTHKVIDVWAQRSVSTTVSTGVSTTTTTALGEKRSMEDPAASLVRPVKKVKPLKPPLKPSERPSVEPSAKMDASTLSHLSEVARSVGLSSACSESSSSSASSRSDADEVSSRSGHGNKPTPKKPSNPTSNPRLANPMDTSSSHSSDAGTYGCFDPSLAHGAQPPLRRNAPRGRNDLSELELRVKERERGMGSLSPDPPPSPQSILQDVPSRLTAAEEAVRADRRKKLLAILQATTSSDDNSDDGKEVRQLDLSRQTGPTYVSSSVRSSAVSPPLPSAPPPSPPPPPRSPPPGSRDVDLLLQGIAGSPMGSPVGGPAGLPPIPSILPPAHPDLARFMAMMFPATSSTRPFSATSTKVEEVLGSSAASSFSTSRVTRARKNMGPAGPVAGPPFCTTSFSSLYERDFATLSAGRWVNDEMINGFLTTFQEYVQSVAGIDDSSPDTSRVWLSNTFFYKQLAHAQKKVARWTKKLSLLHLELALFPTHLGGNHWVLFVVDFTQNAVLCFDSLGKDGKVPSKNDQSKDQVAGRRFLEWAELIVAKIQCKINDDDTARARPLSTEPWKVRFVDHIPRQSNGVDCGVFTAMYTVCLLLGIDLEAPDHVPVFDSSMVPDLRKAMAAHVLNGSDLAAAVPGDVPGTHATHIQPTDPPADPATHHSLRRTTRSTSRNKK